MADARFEDGGEQPLHLGAEAPADLAILSALVQDAVLTVADTSWMPRHRRFAALLNRFRWEDRDAADRAARPYERVRSILTVGSVLKVASNGVDPRDRDTVLSVLSLDFAPGQDGAGTLTLTLAGDGAIALDVECLDVTLRDVTRPYRAVSGKAPGHPDR